jgi:hypothetical protein
MALISRMTAYTRSPHSRFTKGAVVFAYHHRDDIVHEGLVLRDFSGVCEVERQHEVDVAVEDVPPDDGVFIVVALEVFLQFEQTISEVLDRYGDVLDDDRRSLLTTDAGRREQTLADVPQGCRLIGIGRKFEFTGHGETVELRIDFINLLLQAFGIGGSGLD